MRTHTEGWKACWANDRSTLHLDLLYSNWVYHLNNVDGQDVQPQDQPNGSDLDDCLEKRKMKHNNAKSYHITSHKSSFVTRWYLFSLSKHVSKYTGWATSKKKVLYTGKKWQKTKNL